MALILPGGDPYIAVYVNVNFFLTVGLGAKAASFVAIWGRH
jgi:hypothetical protein